MSVAVAHRRAWAVLVFGFLSAALVAGCATTVQGAGVSPRSPSGPGTSTPDFPSGSTAPPATTKYPRTAASSAIGDPATADLCASVPLDRFDGLGYTPEYSSSVYPPGCGVRMNKGDDTGFTVYVYGVGSNSFSHLSPGGQTTSKQERTETIAGLTVYVYAFDKALGDCARDVVAEGVTLKVTVFSRAPSGKASKNDDCAGADVMTKAVAQAAAAGAVPQLELATPSASGIDFCAALRATAVSDLDAFAGGNLAADGIGDGCQITREPDFYFYVDFAVARDRQPEFTRRQTVGGHQVFASTSNSEKDATYCSFVSTQGRTPDGRYEQVSVSASDYSSRGADGLCDATAMATARFLDTAGLD